MADSGIGSPPPSYLPSLRSLSLDDTTQYLSSHDGNDRSIIDWVTVSSKGYCRIGAVLTRPCLLSVTTVHTHKAVVPSSASLLPLICLSFPSVFSDYSRLYEENTIRLGEEAGEHGRWEGEGRKGRRKRKRERIVPLAEREGAHTLIDVALSSIHPCYRDWSIDCSLIYRTPPIDWHHHPSNQSISGSSSEAVDFVSRRAAMIVRMRGLPFDCTEDQIVSHSSIGPSTTVSQGLVLRIPRIISGLRS